MPRLLIFGPGHSARRIAALVEARGWEVEMIDRARFVDGDFVRGAIRRASHLLSSVPPLDGHDPVLALYGQALAVAPLHWVGYLSSTGVYGDAGGAWIDESAPLSGRRNARIDADRAWQALRSDVSIFRLPGIYGPGRSPFDKLREGSAHRIAVPGHVFSRIHVDDLARGVVASMIGPPGIYHLADDCPAPQEAVVAYAAQLLRMEPPPLQTLGEAGLSPMARGFYSTSRRISNAKARNLLGWRPLYPSYREGLMAVVEGLAQTPLL